MRNCCVLPLHYVINIMSSGISSFSFFTRKKFSNWHQYLTWVVLIVQFISYTQYAHALCVEFNLLTSQNSRHPRVFPEVDDLSFPEVAASEAQLIWHIPQIKQTVAVSTWRLLGKWAVKPLHRYVRRQTICLFLRTCVWQNKISIVSTLPSF